MLLTQRLQEVAEDHPDRRAVCSTQESLTFRDLWGGSQAVAAWLQQLGVEPGDRVAIVAENRVEGVVAFWAALAAGGIAVVLNRQLERAELAEILDHCEPAAVLTTGALTRSRLSEIPFRTLHLDPPPAGEPPEPGGFAEALTSRATPRPWQSEDTEPAVIVYTSGSSGKSKGVCLSHRNLWTVLRTVIDQTGLDAGSSYLMVVPLHYIHGIMMLFAHHLAGAAVHLASDFLFPVQIVHRLREEAITGFSGVPLHLAQLLDRGGFLETDLPHLRWVTITGGKSPKEHLQRLLEGKPGLEVFIAYGQTECAPRATLLDPGRLHRKLDSVGAPIPGVEVLILDPDDGSELPRGEIGEVVVAGDNIMLGYWRDPEATRDAIDAQGRLHTGDLGYFDPEGDLFLTGRRSSMIKSGGERIFAERIEQVLHECPQVGDAVVLGVPDPTYGERIEAHVQVREVPRDEAAAQACRQAIREHVLSRLPLAHAPKRYHLWSELPYKANGKVDREAVRTGSGGSRCTF